MPIKEITQIFQIEKYVIEKIKNKEDGIYIYCHSKDRGMWFNKSFSNKVTERRVRKVSHMMLENKPVYLVISQRRFYFPKHKTKRWEQLPDIKPKKQTTNTFQLHTLRELQRDNYSGSGHKRNKSSMFPIKILDSLKIEIRWRPGTKKIGLDGKYVKKHSVVHHMSDLEKGKSIGVFPNYSQQELKKNFMKYLMKID